MAERVFQGCSESVPRRPPKIRLASGIARHQTKNCINCQRPEPKRGKFTGALLPAFFWL